MFVHRLSYPGSKLLIGFYAICFARVFAVFTAVPLCGSSRTAWKGETKACPWSMGQWAALNWLPLLKRHIRHIGISKDCIL